MDRFKYEGIEWNTLLRNLFYCLIGIAFHITDQLLNIEGVFAINTVTSILVRFEIILEMLSNTTSAILFCAAVINWTLIQSKWGLFIGTFFFLAALCWGWLCWWGRLCEANFGLTINTCLAFGIVHISGSYTSIFGITIMYCPIVITDTRGTTFVLKINITLFYIEWLNHISGTCIWASIIRETIIAA